MAATRPFGLGPYLAYMRNRERGEVSPRAPRPEGEVIWLHSSNPGKANALATLGQRLVQQRPHGHLLMTGHAAGLAHADRADGLPRESQAAVQAFLDHWKPDLCLWEGGDLRPALHHEVARRKVPAAILDAGDGPLRTPGPRWLPDLSAAALDRFDRIFATGQDAARRLIRITGSPGRVLALGALGDTALPPPCNPDEHEEMSQTLAGRPVWLAAHVSKAELPDILRAHRRASRLAHRLLLVLVPEDALLYPLFRQQVHEEAMRLCDWAQGDMPDENTQVLLADDPDTLGLWYRIAPLTFVAGSLSAEGGGGHSPFDAAALGSAVLHGPNVSAYRDAYGRLAAVKAARLVNTADDLYRSVIALSAPDKAAVMAHAAWEIVSESANLTDAVIDWAVDVLDQRGAA